MKSFFKDIVFARISQITMQPKRKSNKNPWLHSSGFYTYYCGIATVLSHTHYSKPVYFQLTTHAKETVLIGPIEWYTDIPCHVHNTVYNNDIIFGEAQRDNKGRLRFSWWSCKGDSLFNLYKLLRYKSKQKSSDTLQLYKNLLFSQRTKKYRCTQCNHPAPTFAAAKYKKIGCELCGCLQWEFMFDLAKKTYSQDLWVIYNVLVHNNMDILIKIQGGQTQCTHKASTDTPVYMSYPPQRFMFLLAWYCGNVDLYKSFLTLVHEKTTPSISFRCLEQSYLSVSILKRLINKHTIK